MSFLICFIINIVQLGKHMISLLVFTKLDQVVVVVVFLALEGFNFKNVIN